MLGNQTEQQNKIKTPSVSLDDLSAALLFHTFIFSRQMCEQRPRLPLSMIAPLFFFYQYTLYTLSASSIKHTLPWWHTTCSVASNLTSCPSVTTQWDWQDGHRMEVQWGRVGMARKIFRGDNRDRTCRCVCARQPLFVTTHHVMLLPCPFHSLFTVEVAQEVFFWGS